MRKDENFSLALDQKICNSLWASVIKLQDAFRFTMPDLFLNTRPRHKPKAWISFLINSPTQNYMCTNSVIFNVLLKNTKVRVIFYFCLFFFSWSGGRGEREVGKFLISSPPLSSPVKHTSFSSSKNKNCDPCPWHDGHIDVPNQSRGSWTLVFNSLFCFNILQYSRVTATNTFISQTQFCGFSPLFFT